MNASDDLGRIIAAWHASRERGEHVDPSEVVAAHPDHAAELQKRFAAIALMEASFPRREPVPERIGEFRIVREIGRGGMGVVYEAEQPSMRRRVALKVLLPSVVSSPRAVKRFQREAQATGSLKHTNIVQVYQLGEEKGLWFTALELVDGRPLSDVLEGMRHLRRPRGDDHPPGEESEALTGSTMGSRGYYQRVAEMFADVADALEAAHEHGVVHRDIKPSNLLLDAEGNLKIVDFGLARLDDAAAMTMTGDVVGTPNYMSPEQVLGTRDAVDHRTDVYSLGATLYEVIALAPPFTAGTLPGLVRQIVKEEPQSLRRHDRKVPRDLDTIILRALEKNPRKRFASAGSLARELRAFAQGHTIQTRRATVVEKLWKKAQRHKVRTGLLATIGALAVTALFLGIGQQRETRRRVAVEYDRLIEQAQRRIGTSSGVARDEALALLEEAAVLRPEAPDAYFHRGLVEQRDLDATLDDLAKAEQRGLPARTASLARAGVLWRASRIPEARAELERAAALPGGGPRDDWLEAVALSRQGKWIAATELLDRALREAAPGSTVHRSALGWRAIARGALGDYVGQLEDLSALRQTGLDSVGLRMRSARLWRRLGREREARQAFDELLEAVRAGGSVAGWLELAQSSGEWAVEATAAAVEAYPDEVKLWVARSAALLQSNRVEAALDAAERAVDLDADHAPAWASRANAHVGVGRRWQAWHDAQRARELAPGDRNIGQVYVRIQMDRGRPQLALVDIRQARDENPYDPGWAGLEVDALNRNRQYEEGLEAVERWIALAPAQPRPYLQKARLLRGARRNEDAVQLLEDVLAWEGLAPWEAAVIADELAIQGRSEQVVALVDRLVERNQATPFAYLARATVRHAAGDLDEAIADVRRALALQKRHPASRERLVELLVERGGTEAAVEVLDRWIERDPQEIWPRLRKGVVLRDGGRPAEGLAALEAALELDPTHTRVLTEYATCCRFLSQDDKAYEAAKRALAADPGDPYALANAGVAANQRGDYAEGAAYLERAVALDAREGHFWSALTISYTNKGRSDDALRAAQRGVEMSPDDPNCYMYLAGVEWNRGNAQRALDLLDLARGMGACNPDIEVMRQRTLTSLDRHDEAVTAARATAERWPQYSKARDAHANALLCAGRVGEALREQDAALELAGATAFRKAALVQRAQILEVLGRTEEALAALDEAVELGVSESAVELAEVGSLYQYLGKPRRAIPFLERALAARPEPYGPSHHALVVALEHAGRREEALDLARAQAAGFPDAIDAKAMLGGTLRASGKLAEAIEVLEAGRAASPSNAMVHAFLGEALMAAGDTERFHELDQERLAALRPWVEDGLALEGRHEALIFALYMSAWHAVQMQDREAALPLLEELEAASRSALQRWPQAPSFVAWHCGAAWYRSQLAQAVSDWEGVLRHGEEAIRRAHALSPSPMPPAGLFTIHLACGQAAVHLDELDGVRRHTRDLFRLVRGHPELHPDPASRSQALFHFTVQAAGNAIYTGHPEEALAILDEPLDLEAILAERFHVHRAAALVACGRAADARRELEGISSEALKGEVTFGSGLRAGLLLRDAKFLRRVLEANRAYVPQGTDRLLLLAWRFLEDEDEVQRVLGHLDDYVAGTPPTPPAAARAAWFAALSGQEARARELLERLQPADLPHTALFAARAHASLGDRAEALRYLDHARETGELFSQDPLDPALVAFAADRE